MRSSGFWYFQNMRVAACRDLSDLVDDDDEGAEEAERDRDVEERQHEPQAEQPGRGEVDDRVEALDLEGVDLVLIRIVPISATNPVETFAAIM